MPLSELLWACPECGEIGSLEPSDRAFRCSACDASFERGPGAAIRLTRPDGRTELRTAAEWVDRLPDPADLLDHAGAGETIRRARVHAREVAGLRAVHGEGGYLNTVERFGPEIPGTLELAPDGLRWHPDGEEARWWPFESLTAIQGSSHNLQIKRSGAPLASFRFDDDSVYLWESLLSAALRASYRRTGRGEILEFQPRIATER